MVAFSLTISASPMLDANALLIAAFAHHQSGRMVEAEEQYRLILEREPTQADVWQLSGALAAQSGHPDLAAQRLLRAMALSPESPTHLLPASAVFNAVGRPDVGEILLRRALRLRGDIVEALHQLCERLGRQGRYAEAISLARVQSLLAPDAVGPILEVGAMSGQIGRIEEARTALHRAARLDPTGGAAFNLAWLDAMDAKRHDRAVTRLSLTLAANPTHIDALHNLGCGLLNLSRPGEAAIWLARANRLAPHRVDVVNAITSAGLYLPLPDAEPCFQAARAFEERFLRPIYPPDPAHANWPDPNRRLRVGYLSTDLHSTQPVARNLEPVLRAHDRERFELFVYSDTPILGSTVERFQALSSGWRMVSGLSDEALAQGIRSDGIDILVVLAGHFDGNRLSVCAHRPAPVQISHHDVATSAMPVIDALIVDRVIGARPLSERFTERLMRLPSYVIMAPPDDPPPLTPPPLLRNGFPTFGCFNNPAKMSNATLDLWARVLNATPNARLRLKYQKHYDAPACRARILDRLVAGGVDPTRVEFLPGSLNSVSEHLALYDGVDVALDPFPFSGSTTTFEALFMGVPVVTLPQPRLVARWSASILTTVGLTAFIADSFNDYIAIALRAATDPQGLTALRAELRERVLTSSLCDAPRMARHLERVYRALWRRWCANVAQEKRNPEGEA